MSLTHCFRLTLLLAIITTGYLAVIPVDLSSTINISDKLLHALAFAVLFWLADYSWSGIGLVREKWLSLFFYGLLIEFVQYFIPYREASMFDVLANVAGLLFYAGVGQRICRRVLSQGLEY